jgi:excisionase family DNA binding protein
VSSVANGKTRNARLPRSLDASRMLLAPDVADQLGVAVTTVRQWARTGRLPCFKPPGCSRVFFRQEDIDQWVAGAELEMKLLAGGGRTVRPRKRSL